MASYLINCLNLILEVFKASDNLIVFIPFASLVVSLLFFLTFKLIRGSH